MNLRNLFIGLCLVPLSVLEVAAQCTEVSLYHSALHGFNANLVNETVLVRAVGDSSLQDYGISSFAIYEGDDPQIYFTSTQLGSIYRVDSSGDEVEEFLKDGGEPHALFVDPDSESLFRADNSTGRVFRTDLQSRNSVVVYEGLGEIRQVAQDPLDRSLLLLQISEGGSKIIRKNSSEGVRGGEEIVNSTERISSFVRVPNTPFLFYTVQGQSPEKLHDGWLSRIDLDTRETVEIGFFPKFRNCHYRFGCQYLPSEPTALAYNVVNDLLVWSKNAQGRYSPESRYHMSPTATTYEIAHPQADYFILRTPQQTVFTSRPVGTCKNGLIANASSDFTVWRPSSGDWFTRPGKIISGPYRIEVKRLGQSGDIPIVMDFNDDGILDRVVWRPSNGERSICVSDRSGDCDSLETYQFGLSGDVPLAFDGSFTVWRWQTGQWFGTSVRRRSQWGLPGDYPMLADLDGDQLASQIVWRPSEGNWYIADDNNSGIGQESRVVQWGLPADIPLTGDYDGDAKADLVVWRPSNGNWYICSSKDSLNCGNGKTIQFGLPGDIPVQKDYDGDGVNDLVVWRPSSGIWYVRQSFNDQVIAVQWGLPGDIPIGSSANPLATYLFGYGRYGY